MRLRITLEVPKLPILYRQRFIALIKEALSRSDPFYKESLYPEDGEHTKKAKPFTFSLSFPLQKTICRERITIDKDVEIEDLVFYFPKNSHLSFYISSSDYQFIVNLYNGLLDMREFPFNEKIILRLNKVFMLNERSIKEDAVLFRTNSPVLIEDKDGEPLLPLDEDGRPLLPSDRKLQVFNEHFNAIHDRILKDVRGHGLYRPMEFISSKLKKQVVKHTLKGFREKTGKPYMTLTCFVGCFKLKGDPRDLQMLYQIGIGLRTGQGFGMVETV
ncbi:MAG: CRISPR-associated endoribonuclease Cas6 [Thermodesulfovibrionales bacterium]